MSESNIAVARRYFELFDAGDMPGVLSLLAEDVVWDHSGPPGNPLNRVFEGRSGVAEFYEILGQTQEVLAFEATDYFGAGDRVVTLGSMRLKVIATEIAWESDWAAVFTLRDGLVTHWRAIFDRTAEAAAYQGG